ncbi:cell division protein SepF [Eubacterium ruminantium]|uniref:cell division protein SepF n=1 Tax=Eubacterium ruminantium TaxID=42322 RepID=UPI0023F2E819|nr:cell division protein SepF [Eubacterium ruminantium]
MAKKSGKKSFLDYFRVDSEDDYEEEYDGMEEDLFDDEEEEVYVKPKKVKKLKEKKTTSLDNMYSEPDYDNFDSAYTGTGFGQTSTYNTYSKPASSFQQSQTSFGNRKYNRFTREDMQMNNEVKEQNVVSFDKRQNYKPNSEVYVIKPLEFDDAQTVSDFLKAGKTIVINMEGVQIDPAQRIIDFIGGACYGLGGDLKAISANIFIAAPHNIEVSGDLRDEILNESTLSPQLGKY